MKTTSIHFLNYGTKQPYAKFNGSDTSPNWISNLAIGSNVPRIREFMKVHPEVQVVGSHMSLDFYERI